MAEEDPELLSINSFTKHFDDQLVCGICLDQYTDPKTLPTCHHSFCLKCIEKQVQLSITANSPQSRRLRCPTCRVDNLLPLGGAADLPNDFKINSFLSLRKKFKGNRSSSNQQPSCPKHNVPLKAFCETCNKVICCECTVDDHKYHSCYLISECYPRHNQQIQSRLDQLKSKLNGVNTGLQEYDGRTKEVMQEGQQLQEQINTHARQLIQHIVRSQTNLSQQVKSITQQRIRLLLAQKEATKKYFNQLQACQLKIEQSLKELNQHQILTQKSAMIDEIDKSSSQADSVTLQPLKEANIEFSKVDYVQQRDIGIVTKTVYAKTTLEALPCVAKKQSTAVLTLQTVYGQPLLAHASYISSKLSSGSKLRYPANCIVAPSLTHRGKYNITFTPSTRHDQLIVKVGGVDIADSPLTLPVIPTPEMRGKPVHMITEADGPWGIAVFDNGDIVFAECSAHRITILRKVGKKIVIGSTFGSKGTKGGQFTHPCGVAVTNDGHVLVTDSHRLQKLTTNGVCVESVGSSKSGNGTLEFSLPGGIVVHPTTNCVYVADSGNNRIQIFASSLNILRLRDTV